MNIIKEQTKFDELEIKIRTYKYAIKTIQDEDIRKFREARKKGLSLLFDRSGLFFEYGVNDSHPFQFGKPDDGIFTKKEIIKKIRSKIKVLLSDIEQIRISGKIVRPDFEENEGTSYFKT